MAIACIITGCDKKLDGIVPHNVKFEDEQFATPDGFSKVAMANYRDVSVNSIDKDWLNLSDFRGNNIRVIDNTSTNALTAAQDVDAFTFTNSSSKDFGLSHKFWAANYKSLLNINTLLSHVATGESNAVIRQAKAESLFLRAVIYFNLVRLYGMPYYQSPATNLGVPLILRPVASVSERPARATVAATYQQIIDDLQEAIASFTTVKNNSYASKYAAFAMLSRVYLYMSGTFDAPDTRYAALSAQYADSVIINGGYTLLQGAEYTAAGTVTNRTNKEIIWGVNHEAGVTSIPQLLYQPTGPYAGSTQYSTGQFKPSPDLLSLISNTDSRRSLYFTDKYPNNNIDTLSINKYRFNYTQVYTSYAAVPYLRLAEVYLNRAEARLKAGNPSGALADVNVIRQRAGIGTLTGVTGQPLFNEIMLQRRLELAFEGHNSFDYFRNGLPMVRSYTSFGSAAITIQPNSPKVVLRISEDVLSENGNVKQNIQ